MEEQIFETMFAEKFFTDLELLEGSIPILSQVVPWAMSRM